MSKKALEGIRVLDFTTMAAGPTAGAMMERAYPTVGSTGARSLWQWTLRILRGWRL